MRIYSWNVNGLRAVEKKGFKNWFESISADVVCLQEIKTFPDQVNPEVRMPQGYHAIWNPAQKPGYSGTVIWSRQEPILKELGIGHSLLDGEGRVISTGFSNGVCVVNAYFPNSQREHQRLGLKIEFCEMMQKHLARMQSQFDKVILCGDYNIAHRPIDLRNPKQNEMTAGFLKEERQWMESFLNSGYVDSFRHFNPDAAQKYTWWSYRPGVREKNIGWRIDYHCINASAQESLRFAEIHPEVLGSDHCPISLELD